MNLKRICTFFLSSVVALSVSCNALAADTVETSEPVQQDSNLKISEEYEAVEYIADYISQLYIDDTLTKDMIIKNGISKLLEENPELLVPVLKEIFNGVDDYSELFTASEYQDYLNNVNHVFYGIGVTIKKNGEYVEITGFSEENSIAEKTGFMVGDKIYAVNDDSCYGLSLSEVRNYIVGELNSNVHITVLRGDELIELVATRVEVHQNTVTGGIFKDNIGYIKISTFGDTTSSEFEKTLQEYREKGVKKIILDLRNNGGGRMDAAVEIAKQIVPEGKIIDVVYRDSKHNVTYNSELKNKEFDFLTLVNENTASSSEILSSAIQDSGAGKLIGTTTYGKAVVQQVFPLSNGMRFKLTIAQYKTRNGKEINHVGLEPDEFVNNTTKRIDSTQYNQFDFKTKFALGDKGDKILAAKERLAMLKYFEGDVTNDDFDSELKDSIEAFQFDNALCSTGVLDIPTQVKIRDLFEKLETVVDLQLEKAYELFGGNPEDIYNN